MAGPALQMLLASHHEDAHLHRTIVRVGAVCAWVVSLVYVVLAAVTGAGSLWIQAVSPLLAAILMTAQIGFDREDARVALGGSGLLVAVWYTIFGSAQTVVAEALTLVVIAALAMFFVTSHRRMVASGITLALFGLPFLWPIDTEEKLVLAPILAMSFVITHLVLCTIQNAATAASSRYRVLFDTSPTAVLEEDWSESIEYVRSEYTGKPNRLRQFLLAYPAVVEKAVSMAKVLRANEAAVSLLEIDDLDDYLGYRDPSWVNEHTIEGIVDALVSLYDEVPTWEAELPMRTKTGSVKWLHARSMQARPGAVGTSIVVAVADITHMRERSDAMAELIKAKDEFIANVSHELRTPLTAVIGLTSEMAGSAPMTSEEQTELLQLVADQAAEMANIVDDLLVAARSDMGTVSVDIQEVDLIAELEATVEGVGLEVTVQEESLPTVLADPKRVRQILRNLLTNALRYGGPERRVVAGSLSDQAWLEVRDNGPGIPDEEAQQVFEPYVTGHSGAEGSVGLGLAVARQLAELMGGSLQYERSDGESVFTLRLPLAAKRGQILASHAQ
jgi:signal transduction histidine kinase